MNEHHLKMLENIPPSVSITLEMYYRGEDRGERVAREFAENFNDTLAAERTRQARRKPLQKSIVRIMRQCRLQGLPWDVLVERVRENAGYGRDWLGS